MNHAMMRERAMEFTNWLFTHEEFTNKYLHLKSVTFSLCNMVSTEKEHPFSYDFGMTRLVIIPDNEDFVLKLNFDYENPCDYSASEALVYQLAKEKGIEKAFAWCEKLCEMTIQDRTFPVYIMEKVAADEDENINDSYNYYYNNFCSNNHLDPDGDEAKEAFSKEGDFYEDSDSIFEYALETNPWSMELCLNLEEFLGEYDVNDLHAGNWGRRADGDLVMIDYGGYGHNIVREVEEVECDE